LLNAQEHAFRLPGLKDAAGGDDVFRHQVLARIIDPSCKFDSPRVLDEAGVAPTTVGELLALGRVHQSTSVT
jgi:hypothetical protein